MLVMLTCQSVSHVATQLVSTLLGSVSHPVSYAVALSVCQSGSNSDGQFVSQSLIQLSIKIIVNIPLIAKFLILQFELNQSDSSFSLMSIVRDNKELEGVKGGYEGLQGSTREYKRLQRVTGWRGLLHVLVVTGLLGITGWFYLFWNYSL